MKRINPYLLFSCYCIILGYVVFVSGIRDSITVQVRNENFNLTPFVHTLNDISVIANEGFKNHMNLLANTIGNIILFLPFSFLLLHKHAERNSVPIIVIGASISISIECLQYIFLLGVTDIDDVLLNTLGLYIGALLAKQFQKKSLKTRE